MKKVIVRIDDAQLALSSIEGLYALIKDGLTKSKREPYLNTISRFEDAITKAESYDEDSYYHDQLTELDEDY